MAQRGNSREALLDAAEEIVRENGAAHLSFNAISARAGVSKGGLLYHFPTKEALLQALLERVSVALAEARKAESGKLPESATQELKAHILAAGYFHSRRLQGVGIALLAAGAHDPKLLAPAREAREALVERIHSPILPRPFTTIVMLALEGLWALEILGVYTPNSDERQDIICELLRLVDDVEARSLTADGHPGAMSAGEPKSAQEESDTRNDTRLENRSEAVPRMKHER